MPPLIPRDGITFFHLHLMSNAILRRLRVCSSAPPPFSGLTAKCSQQTFPRCSKSDSSKSRFVPSAMSKRIPALKIICGRRWEFCPYGANCSFSCSSNSPFISFIISSQIRFRVQNYKNTSNAPKIAEIVLP